MSVSHWSSRGMAINWGPIDFDSPTLQHPLYIKWSSKKVSAIAADGGSALRLDIAAALFNNESAEVVAYMCSLVRVVNLVTGS